MASMIAAGGHRQVTESMVTLRDYMLREISTKRFSPEINEENLVFILKLEKYVISSKKKLIQQRVASAIQFGKNLGLIESFERVIGAKGQ
jgi:dimeric dUTPase (all-alpha-NTP-PPase superfamily)